MTATDDLPRAPRRDAGPFNPGALDWRGGTHSTDDPAAPQPGLDQQQLFPVPKIAGAGLNGKFGVPPFSVLDTRQGYWIDRKRQWLSLGLRSELGRGEGRADAEGGLLAKPAPNSVYLGTDGTSRSAYSGRQANAIPGGSRWPSPKLREDGTIQRGGVAGRPIEGQNASLNNARNGEARPRIIEAKAAPFSQDMNADGRTWHDPDRDSLPIDETPPGTSIFDPVLTELSYTWYSPPGGWILDPFAGGSVRGIVAAYLGRNYDGVDLRPEQVAANEQQWADISSACPPPGDAAPMWHCADSRQIADLGLPEADLLFTCPPYYDLEIYSDDPDDLSRAQSYPAFLEAYRAILKAACAQLADDRFAVLVVSEIRDPKTGHYRGFIGDTIAAMRAAGLAYYNEAALINRAGSLPLRAGKQFAAGRKLGRSHQAVLGFVKGDGKKAAEACGPVDIDNWDA